MLRFSPALYRSAGLCGLTTQSVGMRRLLQSEPKATLQKTLFLMPSRSLRSTSLKLESSRVTVNNTAFDKETRRYTGKMFGYSADSFVFYAKVGSGVAAVLIVLFVFMKGYVLLSRFSLQSVARLGFFAGFSTCLILYTTCLAIIRRHAINANAVYHQSIALILQHRTVAELLGSNPSRAEFKTYAMSGGFKLPLLRRIRSGSYTLSDLLGLKPRRLQMLFLLHNKTTGYEGLVSCDVVKQRAGWVSFTDVYKSLSITVSDVKKEKDPQIIVLIGRPEDVVYYNILK